MTEPNMDRMSTGSAELNHTAPKSRARSWAPPPARNGKPQTDEFPYPEAETDLTDESFEWMEEEEDL